MTNASIIQSLYEAFGRGDIPFILSHLSPTVDWDYGADDRIPWVRHGQGPEAAAAFFTTLQGLEFHKFQPKAILEGPNLVVALVDVEVTIKETGKRINEEDEVHIWHFEEVGKISRFRHRVDTLRHYEASRK